MTSRAVSPVLGLALLVGLVAAASISLFLITTAFTSDTQASLDHQQAEQSLVEFASGATGVAKRENDQAQFEVRGASDGAIRSLPDDGDTINVTVRDGNDSRVFSVQETLGSVVYDSPDGTQIAYQGGGVWRTNGNGHATMVDPPPFHYRDEPRATLTFPLVLVRDTLSDTGSTSGTMVVEERERYYPDEPTHYNPLRNGSVIVEIDSAYCEGWEYYLKHRTDGSVTEGCDARGVTNESEVRMVLSVPFSLDGVETAAMFENSVDGGYINGTYQDEGHQLQSPTRMVTDKVADCDGGEGTDLEGNTTVDGPGLYCVDEDEMDGAANYTVHTEGGDVEIAVDGDAYDHVRGGNPGFEVLGDGNVTVYVDGDLFTGNGLGGNVFGNESNPAQLRFFVASGNTVGDNSNIGNIYGYIYAPTSDVDLQGKFYIEGGIAGQDAEFGGSGNVTVDSDVTGIEVNYQPGDADVYFLHISKTEIRFDGATEPEFT